MQRRLCLFFFLPVQQSSFYGYMGMLPKRYTQGVMTGESKIIVYSSVTDKTPGEPDIINIKAIGENIADS